MILLGLITGIAAYYWLMPKWAATRIVRKVEAINRTRNEGKSA